MRRFSTRGGDLHLFMNRQAGEFRRVETAPALRDVIALTVGDANADGVLDVVTLDARGSIRRTSANREGWDEQPLADVARLVRRRPRRERLDCFSPIWTTTARSIWSASGTGPLADLARG